MSHPTVPADIDGEIIDIDEKVVSIVQLFNQIPKIFTVSSCQGSEFNGSVSQWDGHIGIRAEGGWQILAPVAFVLFKPLMDSASTHHSVSMSDESPATLWIHFPQSSIPHIERFLKQLLA